MDFWLGEVEAQLSSEDVGRNLAGVHSLLKKHSLVEADISAHEVGQRLMFCRSPLPLS